MNLFPFYCYVICGLLFFNFQIAPPLYQIASANPAMTPIPLYPGDIFQLACPLGCIQQG